MLEIRHATPGDLDILTGFSLVLARESEGREADPQVVRAGMQALLGGGHGFALVAEMDGNPVGMMMVGGTEWSDWSNGQYWWTTGMYVRPDLRRTGVTRALYARLRELAQASTPRVVGLRGYVHAGNETGMRVQERLGRCNSEYTIFEERFE